MESGLNLSAITDPRQPRNLQV